MLSKTTKIWFFKFVIFEKGWYCIFKKWNENNYQFIEDRNSLLIFLQEKLNTIFISFENKNYDNLIIKLIKLNKNPWIINQIKNNIIQINNIKKELINIQIPITFDLQEYDEKFSIEQFQLNLGKEEIKINCKIEYFNKEYLKLYIDTIEQLLNTIENEENFLSNKINLLNYIKAPLNNLINNTTTIIGKWLTDFNTFEIKDEFNYLVPYFLTTLLPDNIIQKIEQTKFSINKNNTIKITINNFDFEMNNGGLHWNIKNTYETTNENILINIDAKSYYPYIMSCKFNKELNYYPRSLNNNEKIWNLLEKRITTNDFNENQTLKLILNKIYGLMNAKYSPLYDPENRLKIAITGQLILIGMINLLNIFILDWKLIQVNTDGLTILLQKKWLNDFQTIMNLITDKTKLNFKINTYTNAKIIIKDINNYVIFDKNKIIKKGIAFIDETKLWKKCQFPIINIILLELLQTKKSFEELWEKYYKTENIRLFSYVEHLNKKIYETYKIGDLSLNISNIRFFVTKKDRFAKEITKKKLNENYTIKLQNCGTNHSIWNHNLNKIEDIKKLNIDKNWYLTKIKNLLEKFK